MKKDKYNAGFYILCFTGLTSMFLNFLSLTPVALYTQSLGASKSMIGIVASACEITTLICLPLSAPLIDAYDKKKIYILTLLINTISCAGLAFSDTIAKLIVMRLLNGIGRGISSAVSMAMVFDSLQGSLKTKGIVLYSTITSIAQAIGPAAGLKFTELFGYTKTFLYSGLLLLLPTFALFLYRSEKKASGKLVISLDNMIAREALPTTAILMLLSGVYSSVTGFITVFAAERSIGDAGLFFTVYSLTVFVIRLLSGKLSEKYPSQKLMLSVLPVFAVAMFVLARAHSTFSICLSAFLAGSSYGMCQPLLQAENIKRAGAERSGVGSTTSFIGTSLGFLFGQMFAGKLADLFSFQTMYMLMIVPIVLSWFMIARLKKE